MPRGTTRAVALGSALLLCAPASAFAQTAITCDNAGDFPCGFQIESLRLQAAPALFKFQSRISQAKLPVGSGRFPQVFVNLKDGVDLLCQEEFNDVRVDNSVLNLEIGRNMSCDLAGVIAERSALSFQLCLGNQENCLRPIALGTVPYSVKATFAKQAQEAHTADISGQANYAHRAAADRDLFVSKSLGKGYFDFYTHPQGGALYPTEESYRPFSKGGFIQWTPVDEAEPTLHIVAKDEQTDSIEPLHMVVIYADNTHTKGQLTVEGGGIHVTGNSDVQGNTQVTGQLKVELNPCFAAGGGANCAPQGATVSGDSDFTGTVRIANTLAHNPAGEAALAVEGGARIAASSTSDGTLSVSHKLTVSSQGASITGNLDVSSGTMNIDTREVLAAAGTTLEVNGELSFDAVAVHGQLSAQGATQVQGHLSALAGATVDGLTQLTTATTSDDLQVGGLLTVDGSGDNVISGNLTVLGVTTFLGGTQDPDAQANNDQRYVNITGDVMTGALTVGDDIIVNGSDMVFGPFPGRGDGGRALVNLAGDVLAINFSSDFTGGVEVQSGMTVNDDLVAEADLDVQGRLRANGGLQANGEIGGTGMSLIAGLGLSVGGNATIHGGHLFFGPHPTAAGNGGRVLEYKTNDRIIINSSGDFGGGVEVESSLGMFGDLHVHGTRSLVLGKANRNELGAAQVELAGAANTGFNRPGATKLLISGYDNDGPGTVGMIELRDENGNLDLLIRTTGGGDNSRPHMHFRGTATFEGGIRSANSVEMEWCDCSDENTNSHTGSNGLHFSACGLNRFMVAFIQEDECGDNDNCVHTITCCKACLPQ